jgi:uncharacterized protein (DUF2147 family)
MTLSKSTALTAFALAASALPALGQASSHNVFGTYYTEGDTSRVTIEDCGDGSPCGRVSWIDPDAMAPGMTPEEARTKTGDPVIGLLMLEGFDKKRSDWRGGTVYDPEDDKTYAARLKRLRDGDLELKGCVGPICQTQVWQVYAGD